MRDRVFLIALTYAWASSACAQGSDGQTVAATLPVDLSPGIGAVLPNDPLVASADSLVRVGRAWRATLLLAPALRTPATASPPVRLVGARAAAAWRGWAEVERILRDAPWLDGELEGEGRELLARAALERDVSAADHARRALAAARTDAQRAVRQVLLARALDRANVRDSAASSYAAAAARIPEAAEWLRLRAAGVIEDAATRSALLAQVAREPARSRVAWTDAQARERMGDFTGAAERYRSVGAEPAALRVEALAARDDAGRLAVGRRIAAYLARGPQPADARLAIEVLDTLQLRLTREEELAVARAAAASNVPARAVRGFQLAAVTAAAPMAASDRIAYAGALARAGRASEAIRLYEAVAAGDGELAGVAAYHRARVMLQTRRDGVGAALRDVVARFPGVESASAAALLLLADLQVDAADLAGAARSLAELTRRYPRSEQAPLARFRAGLLALGSDPRGAAATFDSLATLHPRDEEALPARYWAARALERGGRRADAESRWRALAAEAPLSYYGVLSARRLGRAAWSPPAGPDAPPRIAAVDSAARRIRALQLLGMDVEARFEVEALFERGDRNAAEAATIAHTLIDVGHPARGLRLAVRTLDRGGPISRALLRAAYPVLHADALVENARAMRLDPALVAGLIRQESTWNPEAVSPVGARGLMQLMPSVGASIASGRGYPVWNPVLLFDPDVSMQLGTRHLASSLRGRDDPTRALAAYNAGASRVTRWSRRPGATDPEQFTEWIPFVETRGYVRAVIRNRAVYRGVYGW
ncbi:MAG TPA: transglycosylase SLT domain-containing protein [Gemmatimonadaceae bacterium]|nr:transglycosylase SLT domain-containing protein [Gemmatimonadaceae bacterium]